MQVKRLQGYDNLAKKQSKKRKADELEQSYIVEKIIGRRENKNGNYQYQVRWQGYPDSQATWEPIEHLDNCTELLNEYHQASSSSSSPSSSSSSLSTSRCVCNPSSPCQCGGESVSRSSSSSSSSSHSSSSSVGDFETCYGRILRIFEIRPFVDSEHTVFMVKLAKRQVVTSSIEKKKTDKTHLTYVQVANKNDSNSYIGAVSILPVSIAVWPRPVLHLHAQKELRKTKKKKQRSGKDEADDCHTEAQPKFDATLSFSKSVGVVIQSGLYETIEE
jgi:hypothetical protein